MKHKYGSTALNKSPTLRSSELSAIYYSLVEMILQGRYEATAEALNQLRRGSPFTHDDNEAIRRLIAARLAIKQGDAGEDTSWLDIPVPENSWLAAEKEIVKGHWEYHLQNFPMGITHFKEAERQFKNLGMLDREFLSAFNQIIGEVSGPSQLPPLQQIDQLRQLEIRVRQHLEKVGCVRVQALIHRQKSHAFEDLTLFHAAVEEISKAIQILELHGPASDYQLALLQAADLSLDLGDQFRGRTFFEYVIPPLDKRVEFPHAYIAWRLGGPLPEQSNFEILPGGWKEKFEKLRASLTPDNSTPHEWTWNLTSGEIQSPELLKPIQLKPASLEGRLVQMLTRNKATKNLLIESFWPGQSDRQLLDNRLHRMISRLNKKLSNLIEFDGKSYRLKRRLRTK
ncbi:MAG: hypothetical protein A2X94_06865 [Bdellovibrionales bacterium GWB1_55_8]|nr:MAG: hypothetical protein A2X94_06865 [Bdellovibrionales bacterium GWB1_55_8]